MAKKKSFTDKVVDEWKSITTAEALVDVMGRFPAYSRNNQLLIASQRPEAQFLAGRETWQRLGREVKSDAKAVSIYEPVKEEQEVDGVIQEKIVSYQRKEMFEPIDTLGDIPWQDKTVTIEDGMVTDFEPLKASLEAACPEGCEIAYDAVVEDGYYDTENNVILINPEATQEVQLQTLMQTILQAQMQTHRDADLTLMHMQTAIGTRMLYANLGLDPSQLPFEEIYEWGKQNQIQLAQTLDVTGVVVNQMITQMDAHRRTQEMERQSQQQSQPQPKTQEPKKNTPAEKENKKNISTAPTVAAAMSSGVSYDLKQSLDYLKDATTVANALQSMSEKLKNIQPGTTRGFLRYGIIRYGLEYIRLHKLKGKITNERLVSMVDYMASSTNIVELKQRLDETLDHFVSTTSRMDQAMELPKADRDRQSEVKPAEQKSRFARPQEEPELERDEEEMER